MINFDDFILMHYDLKAYYFTGIDGIEPALEYMYAHTTKDFIHNAIYTANEDGEGSRADHQTTWMIFTEEELPAEFFTKVTLSAEGEERKAAIIAEKEARQIAFEEFVRNNPRTL